MYFQLPLEQLVRHRACGSQIEFAREAVDVLSESDDARFEPTGRGLTLFAAHEEALEPPVSILRDRYGGAVEVRPPRVRCLPGRPLQHPVMAVRVTVRREHFLAALQELRGRGARILEECLRGRTFIVRAEAPLRDLLGLGGRMAALSDGTALLTVRLSHYAPEWGAFQGRKRPRGNSP